MQQTLANISLKMCVFWDNAQNTKNKKRDFKFVSRRGLMNEFESLLKVAIDIIEQNQTNPSDYLANLGAVVNDCDNDWYA